MSIEQTSAGLRDHLFDVLDSLKAGKVTPQQASATARVAQQVHNTVRLEMDAARFVSESRDGEVKKVSKLPSLDFG